MNGEPASDIIVGPIPQQQKQSVDASEHATPAQQAELMRYLALLVEQGELRVRFK